MSKSLEEVPNSALKGVMHLTAFALALVLFASSLAAEAQQPRRVHRIGYLASGPGIEAREEVFRNRLRELGYVEGQNIVMEWRFSKRNLDFLPDLAAELVRLNVDCIVAVGIAPIRAAKQATNVIPIVMGNAEDDPIRHGLIASLARPGGNVTGFINIGSDLAGKRLGLLKEVFPKVSRVAILYDPQGPGGAGHVRESEIAAPALRVQVHPLEVRNLDAVESTFEAAMKGRAEALIVVHTGLMQTRRAQIVGLAAKTRLPVMYTRSDFVLAGGLMSYDADDQERYRGAATYVDKILKGAKPADLPVERPTKFEFLVNLNTATALGLTIPPSVLARADRLIR